MPRGPAYFPSPKACIYCGTTNVRLTDEHIVPYALGGSHVLREASCDRCAKITTKFEQRVARDLWGDARISFSAPTRHRRERKTHIEMPDADNTDRRLTIPTQQYPAGFVFSKMGKAGLLCGLPESVDLSALWQMVVVDDDKRRAKFLAAHPDKKLVIRFRHVPEDFGKLLAKIGYCQTLTALDLGDFRPICLPYVLGTRPNLSYIVGGTMDDQQPEPENGYSLSTAGFGTLHRLMLVALIRLYANTHAPAYHVVVGNVIGTQNVQRVIMKLGTENISLGFTTISDPATRREHWVPEVMPLPFWDDPVA